jgi:hypothetical protein
MALAYRYWSGIGTLEDCDRAVDWYERAADQGLFHVPTERDKLNFSRQLSRTSLSVLLEALRCHKPLHGYPTSLVGCTAMVLA